MSRINTLLFLLFLLSLQYYLESTCTGTATPNFIQGECRATLYPSLCIQSLSSYSSTVQNSSKQLARAGLAVSLSRARSVSSFVSKAARMRGLKAVEYARVKDCVANMGSTVDQLERAVTEVGGMGLNWHQSNIESWLGAAITFQQTCLDGLMEGNVEISIRKRVVDCAHVTSNALALIHRYATKKLP